jgi:hypothetical protein
MTTEKMCINMITLPTDQITNGEMEGVYNVQRDMRNVHIISVANPGEKTTWK